VSGLNPETSPFSTRFSDSSSLPHGLPFLSPSEKRKNFFFQMDGVLKDPVYSPLSPIRSVTLFVSIDFLRTASVVLISLGVPLNSAFFLLTIL